MKSDMKSLKEIGKVIKEIRKREGLSQQELARKLGVTRTAVSMWETGRNRIPFDKALKLATLFEVPLADLGYFVEDEEVQVRRYPRPVRLVPVFDTAVSAGHGTFPEAFQPIDFTVTESATIDYAFIVHGDSMEPELRDGDIILVKATPEVVPGDLIVCIYDNRFYVKWFDISNGVIKLVSENREYSDIIVEPHERFEIIGKVIHSMRTHKRKRFKRE